MTTYDLNDLLAASEICDRLKIARSVWSNWQRRHVDLPPPVHSFAGTDVWYWPEVEEWNLNRTNTARQAREAELIRLRKRIAKLESEE